MREISLDEARTIAEAKGLKPGRVKGTRELEFTRGGNARVDVLDWTEFESALRERNLSVHESGGFLKIMRK